MEKFNIQIKNLDTNEEPQSDIDNFDKIFGDEKEDMSVEIDDQPSDKDQMEVEEGSEYCSSQSQPQPTIIKERDSRRVISPSVLVKANKNLKKKAGMASNDASYDSGRGKSRKSTSLNNIISTKNLPRNSVKKATD